MLTIVFTDIAPVAGLMASDSFEDILIGQSHQRIRRGDNNSTQSKLGQTRRRGTHRTPPTICRT